MSILIRFSSNSIIFSAEDEEACSPDDFSCEIRFPHLSALLFESRIISSPKNPLESSDEPSSLIQGGFSQPSG